MLRQLFDAFVPQKDKDLVAPHKQSEKKLQFSELRYRRLFETAQDGILILDADSGRITDANPFLKDLLGYSEVELLGKHLWEIGVFNDIVDSKEAFLELQKEGYIRYKDLPLQTKDGRLIDVEFVSNVYIVDTQRVIQCNIRDISNRKKAEEAIKARTEELEKLTKSQEETKKAMLNVMEDLEKAKTVIEIEKAKDEAILASIGDGIVAIDKDGKVIVINQAGCKLLGFKAAELLGKNLVDAVGMANEKGNIILKDMRPAHIAITGSKPTITTTNTGSVYNYVRKDKTRFPAAITLTPIIISGITIGAIEVFRDITHEIEIDKAKSEFVSLASHQLRTPLGIIKWYLEALENQEYFNKAPTTMREYFDEIYKSNERVLSLVRDLLSVSRIEQGRVKNAPKSVDPIQIVAEVVKQMQVLASKKKVALRLTVENQKIPSIDIDVLRFREVVENLIGNAIEYTMAEGSIDVSLNKDGDTFLITVKDTGIGIPTADQKKLFTKFFRGEKAVRQNPEGSGLGLYVVKSYIEGWGGKISVESNEGKGSTFTVSLPIYQKRNG